CMLSSLGAQVPGFPVGIPNAIAAPLLAYIAAVASWCGRPSWACLEVEIGVRALVASYLGLTGAVIAFPVLLRKRRIAALRRLRSPKDPRRNGLRLPRRGKASQWRRRPLVVGVAFLVAIALVRLGTAGGESSAAPPFGLRVSVLDVGQGDAILLQPAAAP